MEDVLEVYAEPYDPRRPVVGFDEASKELHGHVADPVPPAPGRPARQDYEYTRHGTANLFVVVEPLAGRRHITVTERRTIPDFAAQMKHLCDELYPDAEVIRVVLDNLNTHAIGSLFATYPPEEAWRLARRLEFHYTPKHASWLNVAECELSVLSRQCLNRRLSAREQLATEVAAWQAARNAGRVKIEWSFRVADARRKLSHLYPKELVR
jgi:DDE superfamily endonuclease